MILSDEITNDPEGLGYSGKTKPQIMVLINGPRTLDRPTLPASVIYEAIVKSEFDNLDDAQKSDIDRILGLSGEIPIDAASKARAVLAEAFDANTVTRPALIDAATFESTRGEEIGFGFVNIGDLEGIGL